MREAWHAPEKNGNQEKQISELRTTVAHYLTPDGKDINQVGLQPDVQIENGQETPALLYLCSSAHQAARR